MKISVESFSLPYSQCNAWSFSCMLENKKWVFLAMISWNSVFCCQLRARYGTECVKNAFLEWQNAHCPMLLMCFLTQILAPHYTVLYIYLHQVLSLNFNLNMNINAVQNNPIIALIVDFIWNASSSLAFWQPFSS